MAAVGSGFMLCAVVKPFKGQPKTFRLDQTKDDFAKEYNLLGQVLEELSRYDLLIGHNIDGFDLDFLRSRAVRLDVPFYLHPYTYDTYKAFKRTRLRTVLNGFGKPSAGLDMVIDFFGMKQEKTKIYPGEWWQAVWGNKKERKQEMDKITKHCKADVRMNEIAYQKLLQIDFGGRLKRYV